MSIQTQNTSKTFRYCDLMNDYDLQYKYEVRHFVFLVSRSYRWPFQTKPFNKSTLVSFFFVADLTWRLKKQQLVFQQLKKKRKKKVFLCIWGFLQGGKKREEADLWEYINTLLGINLPGDIGSLNIIVSLWPRWEVSQFAIFGASTSTSFLTRARTRTHSNALHVFVVALHSGLLRPL